MTKEQLLVVCPEGPFICLSCSGSWASWRVRSDGTCPRCGGEVAPHPNAKSLPPPLLIESRVLNATFNLFKPSGKWGYGGRGYVPESVFTPYLGHTDVRQQLLDANGGSFPGVQPGRFATYHLVVLLDKDVPYGWPIMELAEVHQP